MDGGLPRQLRWSDFVRALGRLGYTLYRSGGGSARTFRKPGGNPELITFHETHGSDTLRLGTLRAYVRKLNISVREFLDALEK
jgi:predicted RNA binding protein YcfA (HicA-like mRNA interferase family)